jgi:hypothetical protein
VEKSAVLELQSVVQYRCDQMPCLTGGRPFFLLPPLVSGWGCLGVALAV